MIISFFGHADFFESDGNENIFLNILNDLDIDDNSQFWFGGYGNYDRFAFNCCKKFLAAKKQCKTVYITPYIDGLFLNNGKNITLLYDEIVYPPLENVPKRFAIVKRNEWIIDNSDIIIFFVNRTFGGAYTCLKYASRKKKKYYNLANLQTKNLPRI